MIHCLEVMLFFSSYYGHLEKFTVFKVFKVFKGIFKTRKTSALRSARVMQRRNSEQIKEADFLGVMANENTDSPNVIHILLW